MRLGAVVIALCFFPFAAMADDGPGLPTTIGESAVAVARAHAAKDAAGFMALASRNDPDPWLLAERLWTDGSVEVARAVARAKPRPSTQGLEDYLQLRAQVPAADTVEAMAREHSAVQIPMRKRRFREALPILTSLAARLRRIGWRRRLASVRYQVGLAHYGLGERAKASAPWRERIKIDLALGRHASVVPVLNNVLLLLQQLRRMQEALKLHAEILAALPPTATATTRMGLHAALGRLYVLNSQAKLAIAPYLRALAVAKSLGKPELIFHQLMGLGGAYQEDTQYANAQTRFEQALAYAEELDEPLRMAQVQTQLGYVQLGLTDNKRAALHLGKALALYRAHGSARDIGQACVNYSIPLGGQGRDEEALALLIEAVGLLTEARDDINLGRALASIPRCLEALDRLSEVRPYLEQALELARRTNDMAGLYSAHLNFAHLESVEGRPEKARYHLEEATRIVEEHGNWGQRLQVLAACVDHERAAGNTRTAVELASQAIAWVSKAATGLAEREAAMVRTRFTGIFSGGALCAHAEGDHEALLTFLESSRALLLRQSLAGGWVSRETAIPPELLEAEVAARKAVNQARSRLANARKRRLRAGIRKASTHLAAKRAAYAAAMERVRRSLRKDSDALAPSTTRVAALRAALPVGSTLIIVGASGAPLPCVALVVRREGTESIELPPIKALEEAVGKVRLGAPTTLKESALADLAKLAVAPLKLRATDKRLLISPAGALSTVPWGLLAPKRDVMFTPSATVWIRQRARPPLRATHVLGLGDPDYSQHADSAQRTEYQQRGGALTRLPFTRMEVNTVADVRLLRKEATETRLASALLEHDAWKAVHFACHGLIDDEDVMGSSLALTADEENDGFLTVREVYRLTVRTQLVTLSACDSGRGEVIQGAGMLGLAQAFMVAGASAVLCSLWRVDDEATRALMVEFYRLWGAKTKAGARRDAVTALRAAQVFVKTHPKHPEWKHPYYWAAWVFWGSPD